MNGQIQLKDGRIIVIDSDFITVRKRKEIQKKFKKQPVQVAPEEDKVILAKLESRFAEKSPTQMEIYKGFLELVKPVPAESEDEIDERFFEELTRVCCRWKAKKGKGENVPLTEEEF